VDPDIQELWDWAERELFRWLCPHMVEHTARSVAGRYVKALSEEGFHPPHRPAKPVPDPPEDPAATTARGYELARQHLGLDQPDDRDQEPT
jgi:hypothetical protein